MQYRAAERILTTGGVAMCGFVGLFKTETARGDRMPGLTAAMDILKRRGQDGQGVFRNEWLTLGHTRLAIIDLSDAGQQPMVDASSRYIIVFNGEIDHSASMD